jgi:SNF2 family DNA or RNA helicase
VKYKFKTKPYAHQREGIKFAFRQFNQGLGAAFLFEPRTGKTKTTIDTMSILAKKYGVRKVLVIAPNRVLGTWVQEISIHSPMHCQPIVWDAKERRKGPLSQPPGYVDLQIIVVNFEAFGTPGHRTASGRRSRADGRFKVRKMIRDWLQRDDALLVVDESHKLKSPSGKASNMIVSMRNMFKYRLILTGTPITKAKRAADIYMQWQLVNPSRFAEWGSTYEDFKEHTGVWTTIEGGIPIWRREKTNGMRDLKRGLHKDGMVIRRSECFDLPEAMPDRIIPVKLTTSGKHYDEMAAQFFTKLKDGEIAEASIPLVVTLRLSQITSGHVGVLEPNGDKMVSRPVRVGTEKLKALKELLTEETIEREEKVVIVARWRADLAAIHKLCKTLGIPSWGIQGGMTRDESDDALRRFKNHSDGPAAMVVQPQAGGVGVDMSTASQMIWYSLTPSWVDYRQMRDRIALSAVGVQYTFLICPKTIDELVYQSLQLDGDVSHTILTRPEVILRG